MTIHGFYLLGFFFLPISENRLIVLYVAIIEICKITPHNKVVALSSLYVKVFNF